MRVLTGIFMLDPLSLVGRVSGSDFWPIESRDITSYLHVGGACVVARHKCDVIFTRNCDYVIFDVGDFKGISNFAV